MNNSKGVSLIALIITIIVIIILAAIVMNASTNTVGNAQYARFAQEFGEFNDQVALDAANVKSNTGIRGQIINDAQMFYMTANGFSSILSGSGDSGRNDKQGVAGYQIPVGYVLTNYNSSDASHKYVLQSILSVGNTKDHGASKGDDASGDKSVDVFVAYVINDGKITNYSQYGSNNAKRNGSADHEFYGDSNGEEYHFVTSNGQIFTLPGYPVVQSDGTIEYHIDSKNGHYYVVAGNSGIEPGDETKVNVNGDVVTNKQPILASYLHETKGIDARTGERLGSAADTAGDNDNIAEDAVKITGPRTATGS